MIDSERLSHIRESVLRDSGRNFEDAYADRAWLLKKLDEQSSKLDAANKDAEHFQKLAYEQSCDRQQTAKLIATLESRLHQLSEDHSHCEGLLHELGDRASRAESRLDILATYLSDHHGLDADDLVAMYQARGVEKGRIES